MKPLPLALLLALAPLPAPGDPAIEDSSYVAPDGSRVLRQSALVRASLREAWDAFTTSEGVRSWAVPVAQVDFRLGGIWESSYDLSAKIGDPANIRNKFIAFVPLRMVAIQAVQAPPGFKHAELLPEIFHVVEFADAAEGNVRITISGVGYRSGEGHDALYTHFEKGNAWSLGKLQRRFAEGPIDWAKALPPAKPAPR
ncbi:MAG: SRPBCC domain-containing protein [Planctomycetes bacterium]|nr:SRPBCC domain-containing protein [Planctomycetota bacterium]